MARVAAAIAAAAGVARCGAWFVRERPGLVVGAGGYASGPAVLAGKLLGVPTMILEQNHVPGATNRWLAPWVDAVCLPSEAARAHLGGRGVVTGNPVRADVASIPDGVDAGRMSLLVFGGSRGARSINRAVLAALPRWARLDVPPRIVHQTGPDDLENAVRTYDAHYPSGLAEVHAFLDDMPHRLREASLVVCRAGATTLAELAAAGRPSILIPYPFAADDHQRLNAEVMARADAAIVFEDRALTAETIASAVEALASDPSRLQRMGRAARSLARPDAARRIADVAVALLEGGRRVP
jgi:UDP-N-acetylglucosamine--N-acetylmuramyl-(pentapeptide) pyrophosphoryl-undecaprenol N-acetylglucosamine transferase